MRSSMGITKIAAFRFWLLLHLFLKVKMCVAFVDAADDADSDINYDYSDEWVEEKERSRPAWSFPLASSSPLPAPASLMRWDGPDRPRGHLPRMHHVRHEQHYLKHRSAAPLAAHPGPYHAHTVTTSTVTGPQQSPQRHPPADQEGHHHLHHHHNQHHQHHQHQHHHQQQQQHQPHQKPPTGGKRHRDDPTGLLRDADPNGLGAWRASRSPQEVSGRKSSTATFRDGTGPISNALPEGSSAEGKGASVRPVNPHSQKYFEDLLTEYKRRSPYYKELHQSRGPQTKALPSSRGKSPRAGPAEGAKKANAKVTESDYDYLYDDEVEEDVQNDGAYGGEARSSSTRAPTTTTSTTTTTVATTTTTAKTDEDESVADGGDSSYSAYLKNAYAMQSNPSRRGNNRFSSQPRPGPTSTGNQHTRHDAANQVRPADDYPPLTRYKMANFGTQEAVAKSYRTYRPEAVNTQDVMNHIMRINTEGSCRLPKPKVIPASSDRTKTFYPQCTILHRCEEDTGCCMDTETCAPKATATVELYFFMSSVGSNRKQVVALSFTNHTECHCVQRGSRAHEASVRRPAAWEADASREGSAESGPACKCPELFRPIFDSDSECYCDCVSGARDCIRFKEGLEHFSMQTRSKIMNNQLKAPSCEYGTYKRIEGRCPTKSERMDPHFSRYR